MIREVHTYMLECDYCSATAITYSTRTSTYSRMTLKYLEPEHRPAGWKEIEEPGYGYGGGDTRTKLLCPNCKAD